MLIVRGIGTAIDDSNAMTATRLTVNDKGCSFFTHRTARTEESTEKVLLSGNKKVNEFYIHSFFCYSYPSFVVFRQTTTLSNGQRHPHFQCSLINQNLPVLYSNYIAPE